MKDYTPLIVAVVMIFTHLMTFLAGFTSAETQMTKEAIKHNAGQYVADNNGNAKFQWFYRE